MNRVTVLNVCGMCVAGLCASISQAGSPTHAYVIEGSAFFGAPGIELASVGYVNLSDPSDVVTLPMAGDLLRFGGGDMNAAGELIAFENTTNALRVIDVVAGGNTLIDSIGYMDSGVAGMSLSNDGSTAIVVTTVGGFSRFVQADAATGAVLSVHNILNFNPIGSLAVVPEGHPTLVAGDLYGLALTSGGSVRLVQIDLGTNTITTAHTLFGVGFNAQFETGLDFSSDGTLYALIQGFDEVSPDVFVEISSHLYTIDTTTGSLNHLGVIEMDQTWDAVTLVIDTGVAGCAADLTGDGELDFFDVSAFLTAFAANDPIADFTGEGDFDFFDVSSFLAAFGAGCP